MHFLNLAKEIVGNLYENGGPLAAAIAVAGGALGLVVAAKTGSNESPEAALARFGFLALGGVVLGGALAAVLVHKPSGADR